MRASIPLFDRLLTHITFPDDLNACFHWHGAMSQKRNGQQRPVIQEAGRGSRVLNAARVICALYQGPAPTPAHEAGHTCPGGEQEDCVNPRHLVWMTRTENEQWKQAHRLQRVS